MRAVRTTRAVRAGIVALAVVGAVGVVGCDDGGPDSERPSKPIAIRVGGRPGLIQATADAIWVASESGVVRLNPTTNEVVDAVEMEQPEYLVSDGTSVWASLFDQNQLVRIDAASNTIVDRFDVPDNPSGAVVIGADIWVNSHRGAAVLRFGAGTGSLIADIPVGEPGPDGPLGMAAGMDSIWVGTPNIFTVSQIDITTDEVIAEYGIPPGANPAGDIAVANGRVEVSSGRIAPSITVIDPQSGELQVVQIDGFAIAVAVVNDHAWWAVQVIAGDSVTSQLIRLDDTGADVAVALPEVTAVSGVVVAFGSVWLSDEANGTVTRYPLDILE